MTEQKIETTGPSFIDEVYKNPVEKENKKILSEFVIQDMISQGLDPINKNDIQTYWASKGIGE